MSNDEPIDPTMFVDPSAFGGPQQDFVHERYDDLGVIGQGGMGEVRRVRDRRLGVTMAMKVLRAELVHHAEARRRFADEARITAMLRHPGIVAVQDQGELEDGRLWYTMTEVQGRTLSEVHRGSPLRERIDRLVQVGQAIAYAHTLGVVHRDLKPDNVMVGAFGEVRVMDWGIARWQHEPDGVRIDELPESPGLTMAGSRLGTPLWMAPEQATGNLDALGPPADVYALGGLIEYALTGQPPGMADPPADAPIPLVELARQSQAEEPNQRPSASELVQALQAWLDGSERRRQALALVADADALAPEIDAMQSEAERLAEEGAATLSTVLDYEPVEAKRPGWQLLDRAEALRVEAATRRAQWMALLRGALVYDPTLDEAHERLAAHHVRLLRVADSVHDSAAQAEHEAMLRTHDRGAYRSLLAGEGTLTLDTEPSGAEVRLYRYEEVDRALVPVDQGVIGTTPLVDHVLPHGSYRLTLTVPERPPVLLPVLIRRGETWRSVPPGASDPAPVVVPSWVPEGTVYVPAGWFEPGGDPEANDPARLGRVWVDGFVLGRDPVTVGEYLAFLDDVEGAEQWLPREPRQGLDSSDPVFLKVGRQWRPPQDWSERRPITLLPWKAVLAYLSWCAPSPIPWRLPHGVEWEKSCRGADARVFATGDHLEPTRTVIASSRNGSPAIRAVDELHSDLSPFGVRGMTGNVADLCGNVWTHDGGTVVGERLVAVEPLTEDARVEVRGGNYAFAGRHCRAAGRFATWPDKLSNKGGSFRLCASWPR